MPGAVERVQRWRDAYVRTPVSEEGVHCYVHRKTGQDWRSAGGKHAKWQ